MIFKKEGKKKFLLLPYCGFWSAECWGGGNFWFSRLMIVIGHVEFSCHWKALIGRKGYKALRGQS